MNNFEFCQIIEVSLQELKVALFTESFHNEDERTYARALINYLEADLNSFCEISVKDRNLSDFLILRRMLLTYQYDEKEIRRQIENVSGIDEKFLGEFYFIVGLLYTKTKDFSQSKHFYSLAYKHLKKSGSPKKAVKSLLNIIVAESRHQEHKKLILDYQFVANEAKAVDDKIVQGICLLNISREHQILGALELALKSANESLDLLQHDIGVDHFYHALIHRCHVLIALGRFNEAVFDYQKAKASQNPEIQDSLGVINELLGEKKSDMNFSHIEPTWKERLYANRLGTSKIKLTKQESILVSILSTGKKTKDVLIQELYGDKIDWFAAESRFKMLLSRFRKKCPDQIIYSNSVYELIDQTYLNEYIKSDLNLEA